MVIKVLEIGCGVECRFGKQVKGYGWGIFDKDEEYFGINGLVEVIQKVFMVGWS